MLCLSTGCRYQQTNSHLLECSSCSPGTIRLLQPVQAGWWHRSVPRQSGTRPCPSSEKMGPHSVSDRKVIYTWPSPLPAHRSRLRHPQVRRRGCPGASGPAVGRARPAANIPSHAHAAVTRVRLRRAAPWFCSVPRAQQRRGPCSQCSIGLQAVTLGQRCAPVHEQVVHSIDWCLCSAMTLLQSTSCHVPAAANVRGVRGSSASCAGVGGAKKGQYRCATCATCRGWVAGSALGLQPIYSGNTCSRTEIEG